MRFLFKDKRIYEETKWISKAYNCQWKKYASRYSIGDCTYLFETLKPKNYADFYEKYVRLGEETYGDATVEMMFRGRTEDELVAIAENYRRDCGREDIPLEDFVKNVILHVIHETFDGHICEREIYEYIERQGYNCRKPEGDEDSFYGIDCKVYKGDVPKYFLQVKPISFFRGHNNESLIRDRINAFNKQEEAYQKYGVRTYYVIYSDIDESGHTNWVVNDGNICFNLDDLIERNGYPKPLPTHRTVLTQEKTEKMETNERRGLPISVDFDATLCYPHCYPNIGKVNGRCFEILKKWQDNGCMIMLNTMRGGPELQDALDWCREHGFEFDAVGRNPFQDEWCYADVNKIYSVYDIDDRNIGAPLTFEDNDVRGHIDWEYIDKNYTDRILMMSKPYKGI